MAVATAITADRRPMPLFRACWTIVVALFHWSPLIGIWDWSAVTPTGSGMSIAGSTPPWRAAAPSMACQLFSDAAAGAGAAGAAGCCAATGVAGTAGCVGCAAAGEPAAGWADPLAGVDVPDCTAGRLTGRETATCAGDGRLEARPAVEDRCDGSELMAAAGAVR
jgi:hypothetical protein